MTTCSQSQENRGLEIILKIFSCDSSSIRGNVGPSVGRMVGVNEFQGVQNA